MAMSDKEKDDRWTIRGVSPRTRAWLISMAEVHGCTIGRMIDAVCERQMCVPVDEQKPLRSNG